MNIYKLHDHIYIDGCPTVTIGHLKVVDQDVRINIKYKRVETQFKILVFNDDVTRACNELNILRHIEDDDSRYEYFDWRDDISYQGRKTYEHKRRADKQVFQEALDILPERIYKSKKEIALRINTEIERHNEKYTSHAMHTIPDNLRRAVSFDKDKEVDEYDDRIKDMEEQIEKYKQMREDLERELSITKNQIFVRDANPGDIYPEQCAPHVQEAVYNMAENNELFIPPIRSIFG